MNATQERRLEAVKKEFPKAIIREAGDKIKFNTPKLDPVDVTKLSGLDELYMIEIKRSGAGLVIIID